MLNRRSREHSCEAGNALKRAAHLLYKHRNVTRMLWLKHALTSETEEGVGDSPQDSITNVDACFVRGKSDNHTITRDRLREKVRARKGRRTLEEPHVMEDVNTLADAMISSIRAYVGRVRSLHRVALRTVESRMTWICDCKGFMNKSHCSHIVATEHHVGEWDHLARWEWWKRWFEERESGRTQRSEPALVRQGHSNKRRRRS